MRDRHCELQPLELDQLEILSLEASRRYLRRIKWFLDASHRLWFQSCLHTFDSLSTVVILVENLLLI